MSRARLSGSRSRHAGNAARAARTALSTSSACAAETSAIVRLVAGSMVGTVAPPAASTQLAADQEPGQEPAAIGRPRHGDSP